MNTKAEPMANKNAREGQPSPRNIEGAEPDFEDWWQGEGQFCRAGGGDYEKTFSYRAWQKATAREAALQSQIDALTLELSNEMRRQFPGIAAAHPVEGAEGWTGVYYDSARDGDGPPAVEGEAARAARQPRALWGDIRVRDAYSALKALTCSIEGSETAIERYAQACFAWARSSIPNVAARAAEPVAWRWRFNGEWHYGDRALFKDSHTTNQPLFASPPTTAADEARDAAIVALKAAQQFIRNGVAFGYIRMPDADCPDPARETPGLIDRALAAMAAAPPKEPT